MNEFHTILYAVTHGTGYEIGIGVFDSAYICGVKMLDYVGSTWDLFCKESTILSKSLIPPKRPW